MGNLIVVDNYYKEQVKDSLYQYNQSNYIDILNRNEIETIINLQIKETTYFDRIEEEESKYLVKNIDTIAERLMEDYKTGINISNKIDSIIQDILKDKGEGIEGRNENISLKAKMEKAKGKAERVNKNISPSIKKNIERN